MPATVKLDNGISYDCAEEVAVEFAKVREDLAKAQAKLDEADKATGAVTAERDKLQGKVEELEKAAADFDAKLDEAVKAGVAERATVLASAKKVITEDAEQKKLDELTIPEIRKAVILARDPEAKLDGKSEAHLDGMFEVITNTEPADSQHKKNGEELAGDGSGSGKKLDAADAEKAYEARVKGWGREPLTPTQN